MRKATVVFLIFLGWIITDAKSQITIEEARALPVGTEVTISGIVTNGSELGPIRYIQDETGAIPAYPGAGSATFNPVRGDLVTVTGKLKLWSQLLEIDPVTEYIKTSSGNPLPAPQEIEPNQMGPSNEGELVTMKNVSFTSTGTFAGNTNYNVTRDGKTGQVRISTTSPLKGQVIPTGTVNLVGISSRYFETYQLLLRDEDDILPTSSIYFTSLPLVSNLNTSGFNLNWTTNTDGTTEMFYGNTPALEKGKLSIAEPSSNHEVSISGASPSELFYIQPFSVSGADTARLGVFTYITSSESTGNIKVYFNSTVDNSYATHEEAFRIYRAIEDTLINYINRAKYNIDLSIYNFNNNGISNITGALNAAHNRGVTVRVIYDSNIDASGVNTLDAAIGKQASPASYYPVYGIMHNKFLVFDALSEDPDDSFVWTGSTNLTQGQLYTDPNSVIIIQDKSLAITYMLEFNEMFGSDGAQPSPAQSRFGPDKKNNTPHDFIIGGRKVECYFSPSDGVNSLITSTIDSAKSSLHIATMLITRSDIGYSIRDAYERGVIAKVLVNSRANCSPTVVSTLDNSLGADFIEDQETGIMHHKYMIIDRYDNYAGPKVLVGCHNWSTAADERNDENTLVIHDYVIANIYFQEFVKRFTNSGGSVTRIEPSLTENQLTIYPNPARRLFHIGLPPEEQGPVRLGIYDLSGKMVYNISFDHSGSLTVDIGHGIKTGMYILKLETGRKIYTGKIIFE